MAHTIAERPLGELVSENPRAALVFDRFGLDYCCRGHQTLAEAARRQGLPVDEVVTALAGLDEPTPDERTLIEQDLGDLIRHIVERHHRYVREISPAIAGWLDKLVGKHGRIHPELLLVREAFRELRDELTTHMMKEENILFPFIEELAAARRTGSRLPRSPFGTVLNPVRMMEHEHQHAGALMDRLRTLTDGFTPPPDACQTFRLCYCELATFEHDLHAHVHLENNALFPRALEIESELA